MKNSQVFALSLVILLAAAIVAGSNWLLLRDLQKSGGGSGKSTGTESASDEKSDETAKASAMFMQQMLNLIAEKQANSGNALPQVVAKTDPSTEDSPRAMKNDTRASNVPAKNKKIRIGMMPKSLGNAYFIACRKGAEQAANELGVEMDWQGPTDPDPAKQSQIVDTWITSGVDVIAVAVENRDAISPVLKKARERGIKVITWDADADPAARDFFVNQATPQGIGYTLMDHAARLMGGKGEFAIIVGSITAANMIEWQKYIKERMADKYPNIKLIEVRPCDDKQGIAMSEANTMLNAYPDMKLIMAICSPGVPGAAEAVKQSGRTDVKVIGLGLPNDNKSYVKEGVTDCIVLWNTMDLGYLTVYAADEIVNGSLKAGDTSLTAGRLGKFEIQGDNILLGKPFTFTKENIDQFDF